MYNVKESVIELCKFINEDLNFHLYHSRKVHCFTSAQIIKSYKDQDVHEEHQIVKYFQNKSSVNNLGYSVKEWKISSKIH